MLLTIILLIVLAVVLLVGSVSTILTMCIELAMTQGPAIIIILIIILLVKRLREGKRP